jgi:hypothetical protein
MKLHPDLDLCSKQNLVLLFFLELAAHETEGRYAEVCGCEFDFSEVFAKAVVARSGYDKEAVDVVAQFPRQVEEPEVIRTRRGVGCGHG